MKRFLFTFLIILICFYSFSQDIQTFFPEKWRTEIGLTTFRTNIIFDEFSDRIIIGSNGKTRALITDPQDGVYFLDPSNGITKLHIKIKGAIDGDVNGVTVSENYIYFGNDNCVFYCYDKNGNKVWEFDLSEHYQSETGDIEGCPSLFNINNDEILDVVFTVESFGLLALDGKSGVLLWDFISPSYSGYLNSQAIFDLNDDGVKDVIFGAENHPTSGYGDRVVALNGSNGSLLWEYPVQSGIHASCLVLKRNNNIEILVTECYSVISFLDKKGKPLKFAEQTMRSGGISGLFSSPVVSDNELLIIGTSWWGDKDGIWMIDIDDKNLSDNGSYKEYIEDAKSFVQTGLVSSSAFIADIFKSHKGNEIGICTENGELILFNRSGKLIHRVFLPDGVEASPLVKDIDNDGELELLIACLDGYLYCYETGSKGKVLWGQFRGDNQNQGFIEIK